MVFHLSFHSLGIRFGGVFSTCLLSMNRTEKSKRRTTRIQWMNSNRIVPVAFTIFVSLLIFQFAIIAVLCPESLRKYNYDYVMYSCIVHTIDRWCGYITWLINQLTWPLYFSVVCMNHCFCFQFRHIHKVLKKKDCRV